MSVRTYCSNLAINKCSNIYNHLFITKPLKMWQSINGCFPPGMEEDLTHYWDKLPKWNREDNFIKIKLSV